MEADEWVVGAIGDDSEEEDESKGVKEDSVDRELVMGETRVEPGEVGERDGEDS